MSLKKTHLIDRRPWWAAVLIAFGYILAFIICVGVGGNGPQPASSQTLTNNLGPTSVCIPTNTPAACSVTYQNTFSGLSGYNQALYLVATMDRPIDLSTGQPALLNAQFSIPVDFTISATGTKSDGTVETIASAVTNSVVMNCQPGRTTCGYGRLFNVAFLFDTSYTITTTFNNPYQGFISAGLAPSNINGNASVGINMIGGTINPAFTRFQINSKYTFLALSIIMLGVYIYFLNFGKGAKDPRNQGAHLPSTPEQNWLLVLAIWLCWANDPFAAVSLTSPSYAASGFYAFCAITFLVLLLLYWLVIFDLARDPANANIPMRLQPLGASAQLAKRCNCGAMAAATLFWLPKLLWCTVTWVLLLSYYLVQRAAWMNDPTFDVFSAFPYIRQYFFSFAAAWGAFYVIYLAVLMIMGLYHCRNIAPSSRYILAITIITIIAVLCGYFLNGVLSVTASNSSVLFMTATGAMNVYVYFLIISYLPAFPWTASEAIIVTQREAQLASAGASGENVALSIYGGIIETAASAKKVPQSESYTQTDESAFLPGVEHGDSGTCVIISNEEEARGSAAGANAGSVEAIAAAAGAVGGSTPSSVAASGDLGSPVDSMQQQRPAKAAGRISFASILGGGKRGGKGAAAAHNNAAPAGGKAAAAAFTGSAGTGAANNEVTATSTGVALAVPVPAAIVVDDDEEAAGSGAGGAEGPSSAQSWK